MNYKGWRRRRPMKGPGRKPFMPMPSLPGIIASGAQRADPDHWRARAEAEQEAEAGLQGKNSGAFSALVRYGLPVTQNLKVNGTQLRTP